MSTPSKSTINKIIHEVPDEVRSAEQAGLRYTIPKGRGIKRKVDGDSVVYVDPHDRPVEDEATLQRIKSLVIPPAWTSVWINPSKNGHIQAVGWDAKGRKQYRYHPAYREARDLVKFDRMQAFGRALPKIREIVDHDLSLPGMPKPKVLAAVVKLLETTFIRIGNEEYAEENGSFGLTTLRNQHCQILGGVLKFKFRGKSGQHHDITLKDKRLAKIVRRCKDIPGSSLFEFLDAEGNPQTLESGDVNEYLREVSGGEFTAKDFRTWGGTCLAANYLLEHVSDEEGGPTEKAIKSAVVDVVKNVACKLGNKPATCRKYYIHPTVLEMFTAGTLRSVAEKFRKTRDETVYEQVVLAMLKPMQVEKGKSLKTSGGKKAAQAVDAA